jgi:magnesium chelatase subunit I
MNHIQTLGALKISGYQPKSIKDELRNNLILKIKRKETVFKGIFGFENTVIPDLERAVLSRHSILLLGLRGQAKTKMARLMVTLLDEYIPVVAGSEVNDDPLQPLSRYAKDLIAQKGDDTPITWMHRSERYVEKLATPDVSVADLIGDVDPILAANLKLPYSDERVIHFGLVPRSHRCIFVINELPDLQARIQVSLFNILQEGDIQIRGFKLRLPLDLQFVFTANPEDYTNRGSIITPLKDRIQSQILTHYPEDPQIAMQITEQEAKPALAQKKAVKVPDVLRELLEAISFAARESELVDNKSGVSARLSITALENLYSTAERRMLLNGEKATIARLSDFWGIVPAITGKIELVYEGEQEGPYNVAMQLFGIAVKALFLEYFPNPEEMPLKRTEKDPYGTIRAWFSGSNTLELLNDSNDKLFKKELDKVAGLRRLVETSEISEKETSVFMELVLHGLAEFNIIQKDVLDTSFSFSDPLADMMDDFDERNN